MSRRPRPGVKVRSVQKTILRWFRQYQRDLPWRRTRDPYKILVSEIMLQQTQVDRVIPKYQAFLHRFPNLGALARATPREVLLAWAGLGYNRRALYLLRAAQDIITLHKGTVPTDPVTLRTLPGVGPYTAAAVATFSSGVPYALADTNVRRVIGRVVLGVPRRGWKESQLQSAIERFTLRRPVAGFEASLWGHAVMDFGALVCKAKPRCDVCPLRQWCKAYPQLQRAGAPVRQRPGKFLRAPPVPNRLYRGRILQILREQDPKPVSFAVLSGRLRELPPPRLRRLLKGLAREGLAVFTETERARLPVTDAVRAPRRGS